MYILLQVYKASDNEESLVGGRSFQEIYSSEIPTYTTTRSLRPFASEKSQIKFPVFKANTYYIFYYLKLRVQLKDTKWLTWGKCK